MNVEDLIYVATALACFVLFDRLVAWIDPPASRETAANGEARR